MNTCLFCNKPKAVTRPKYCSIKCIKRSWYAVRNPNSYFNNSPNFWKTETGIAFKWEKIVAKILGATHKEFNEGEDIYWNGKRVDVKVCNLYKRKFAHGKPVKSNQAGSWIFNRNKKKDIDFFFCISLIKDKPHKMFLIPSSHFPEKGITIGWKSKYDKYRFSPNP